MINHLRVAGTYNIRDLGGYPAAGGVTRSQVFIRAGNLDQLPPESQQQLIDYGVKNIVDLRDEWEVQQYPNVFAQSQMISYVNAPLIGNGLSENEVWKAEAENYDALHALYCKYLDECQTQVRTIITAIADSSPATIFHCYAGKDRTGIIAALVLASVGVPDPLIAQDYAESNQQITHLIEAWRAYALQNGRDMKRFARDVGSDVETMLNTLNHLKRRYGGATGYLQSCGITDTQLTKLHSLLVQPIS